MGVSIRQSFKHIDASDRSLIQQQLSIGRNYRSIAAVLGRPAWTISREVVRNGVKMPKEWLQSVIDSAKISKLGLPVVIPVAEFRDLVGAGLTATLSGGDPATELKKAHEQFRPILERSEKS